MTFFENSPNFAIVNPETGEVEVDENGETVYENYGGFMDRTRLRTQIVAENILSGKRYFAEQVYYLNYMIKLDTKKPNLSIRKTSESAYLIMSKKKYEA